MLKKHKDFSGFLDGGGAQRSTQMICWQTSSCVTLAPPKNLEILIICLKHFNLQNLRIISLYMYIRIYIYIYIHQGGGKGKVDQPASEPVCEQIIGCCDAPPTNKTLRIPYDF